jgi:hypothetical protein
LWKIKQQSCSMSSNAADFLVAWIYKMNI